MIVLIDESEYNVCLLAHHHHHDITLSIILHAHGCIIVCHCCCCYKSIHSILFKIMESIHHYPTILTSKELSFPKLNMGVQTP
mmetsp:Transcript_13527/g.20202  ORF Transcript_13527/g.20202 Transcript_13527/m.20202 type:complete len:83 (+) Transcript_13527:1063-1311(+)